MSTPYYEDESVTLYHGDCIDILRQLPDNSVDAVVTDPPYALSFMGRGWDTYTPLEFEQWCASWATECLRVLKPGGHLLAFGGTRTWHRLAAGIEDAGFEVRDNLAWLYGSGFPKSLDVSKAIDKAAGATREIVGQRDRYLDGGARQNLGDRNEVYGQGLTANGVADVTAPATDEARTWAGWGTALKPAFEPIVMGRKPLTGTVANNVLTHGTGALNIDASRVGTDLITAHGGGTTGDHRTYNGDKKNGQGIPAIAAGSNPHTGRWPANVLLGHHHDCGTDQQPGPCVDGCPVRELDQQSGVLTSGANPTRRGSDKFRDAYGDFAGQEECIPARGADSGGASRFFPTFRYQAKAPTAERPRDGDTAHPTVKPLALMRWLITLVTPSGGVVLEPFAGSGTTIEAAILDGYRCIAIEREDTYLPLIVQRINRASAVTVTEAATHHQPDLFDGAA